MGVGIPLSSPVIIYFSSLHRVQKEDTICLVITSFSAYNFINKHRGIGD